MSKLDILTFPDPRLRRTATPVTEVNDGIRRMVDDMLETMYAAPGIGLAAIQVEISEREGKEEMEEGCLSVPGFYEPVTRAQRIRVRALNRDGEPFEQEADGLLAVCIQHEVDHLEGKLFVDYISSLKRQRIRKKLEKDRRQPPAAPAEARRRAI